MRDFGAAVGEAVLDVDHEEGGASHLECLHITTYNQSVVHFVN